jgi:hypothetical protein
MIKGYGNVRRRTMDILRRFLDNIIIPLAELEHKRGKGFDLTLKIGEESLRLISQSADGIDKAEKLAKGILKGRGA